LNESTFEEDAN